MKDVALLTNEELIEIHSQEETYEDVYYWRECDDELNFRVEDGQLDWPYDGNGQQL